MGKIVSTEKKLTWICPRCRKTEELDRHHANPTHRHEDKLYYMLKVRPRTELKNEKEK